MSTKTFNVSFPKELADLIDKKAKQQFGSRSDLLRYAAVRYLREEQEFEELMAYGKEIGKTATHQAEAEVAAYITAERRQQEPWRKAFTKHRSR